MSTPPRERTISRRGVPFFVRDAGDGPPLVLLHGFGGSGEAWPPPLLEGLARSYRVITLDLHGHGRSGAPAGPAGYAMTAVVEDLAGLVEGLGARRAHWVGYSMGGRVALGVAALEPGRVDRLVLESASPGLATEAERARRREEDEALARSLENGGVEAWVDDWMARPLFQTQRALPDALRASERARRLRNRPHALAACLRGLGTGAQPSFWERLGALDAPTFLMTGELDARFTETARRMHERLPHSERVVVEGTGHAVHLERPGAWIDAVMGFLNSGRGGGA